MRSILLALFLATTFAVSLRVGVADDDTLRPLPPPPLNFGGRVAEGMSADEGFKVDDDTLEGKPTPDLNFGGRSTEGEGGVNYQGAKPRDPLGISPVIEAILGG